MRSADDDLHTAARIRNAAIVRFGADGFDVGLRAIAADAGVSPALVIHHFGSKARLRDACDEHVLAVIRAGKTDAFAGLGAQTLLDQMARLDEYAPLLAYVVASLSAGGDLARRLVEHMVDDAVDYLATGVANGTIRPSRDPRSRARYLVLQSVGALLLQVRLGGPEGEPLDPARAMDEIAAATFLPALEIYTEGLLTSSSMLDTYLAQTSGAATTAQGAPE